MATIMDAQGHEHKVTSQGQGNLNTVLGAVGTAGALNMFGNSCGNGVLGGLFGGNNYNSGNCPITEKEFQWAQAYNTKQSEVDMLKSDQRTDGKLLEIYREIDRRFTTTGETIASLASGQAVINQKLNDTIVALDSKIDTSIAAIDAKINCNVASIYREIDCRTLPLEKKVPLDSICPQAAPLHPDVQQVQLVSVMSALQALTEAVAAKK